MLIEKSKHVELHKLNVRDYLIISPFSREHFDRETENHNRINAQACFNIVKNLSLDELKRIR